MLRRWIAALVLVAGCSSTQRGALAVPVSDIPAAVAAVAKATPATRFTEIKVTPEGVTLFAVTAPGKERSYLYVKGTLAEPGPEDQSDGESFALTGIPLDQGAKVAAFVTKQYPGAVITTVSLVTVKPNGLVWAVRSQSTKGGLLNSLFSPDGNLISAFPAN